MNHLKLCLFVLWGQCLQCVTLEFILLQYLLPQRMTRRESWRMTSSIIFHSVRTYHGKKKSQKISKWENEDPLPPIWQYTAILVEVTSVQTHLRYLFICKATKHSRNLYYNKTVKILWLYFKYFYEKRWRGDVETLHYY